MRLSQSIPFTPVPPRGEWAELGWKSSVGVTLGRCRMRKCLVKWGRVVNSLSCSPPSQPCPVALPLDALFPNKNKTSALPGWLSRFCLAADLVYQVWLLLLFGEPGDMWPSHCCHWLPTNSAGTNKHWILRRFWATCNDVLISKVKGQSLSDCLCQRMWYLSSAFDLSSWVF